MLSKIYSIIVDLFYQMYYVWLKIKNDMKNKKLFNETVDILVKAYMNDTLEHGSCSACAVGNIITARLGDEYFGTFEWFDYIRGQNCDKITEIGKEQVQSTGYSFDDVVRIEQAFESAGTEYTDENGYKGLMAVVTVLCEIHECEEIKEETKALFVK